MTEVGGGFIAAGFDAAVMEELTPQSRTRLGWVANARRASCALVSLSAGVAAFIAMHRSGVGFIGAILLASGIWLLLTAVGRLTVSAGGSGVATASALSPDWRPSLFYALFVLVAGLLAAQPLLLVVNWRTSEQQIVRKIDDLVAVNFAHQRDILVAGDNQLKLQRAQLVERLSGGGQAAVADSSRRKALVIGAQNYRYSNKLNNPARDSADVGTKLRSMGFDVTVSVDETEAEVSVLVSKYIQSLKPGDISVVFYSGHGYQRDGHNYIVPIDFDGQRVTGIRVTRILEDVSRRSPQLQVIILDACRVFTAEGFSASSGGLAELQGGANSFIAMAAQPGKMALDGVPGTNGLFTEAILRHIDRPEDINTLFRRISADAADLAERRNFVQQPVVTSTLRQDYIQLIDPAIKAPASMLGVSMESRQDDAEGEDDGVGHGSGVCAPLPGLPPEQQREVMRRCLNDRVAAIDRSLGDWRSIGATALQKNARGYRDHLQRSGLLTERIREVWWTSPVWAAFFSVVFAAIIAASEGLVWLFRGDFGQYFAKRNQRAERSLESSHAHYSRFAESELVGRRHESYAPMEPFRTMMDWKGFVDCSPEWSLSVAAPTADERKTIHEWLQAVNGRKGELS